MVGYALLAFGFGAVFFLLALKPRAVWWTTSAWAHRHPEAHEPSDTAYGLQSVVWIFTALACVVGGVLLLGMESPEEREQREEQQEAHCEEVMSELEQVYASGGVEAVQERAHGLGMETQVQAPPVYGGMESSFEVPASVLIYDRSLPEQEQFLGSIGGLTSSTYC